MSLASIGILFLSCVVLPFQDDNQMRKWSDDTGQFSVEAIMIVDSRDKLTDDVRLKSSDGQTLTVPVNRLDRASQQWVRKLRRAAKARRNADQGPGVDAAAGSFRQPNSSESSTKLVWNWRGPNRDGVSPEKGLLSDWNDKPPNLLWTAEGLGSAYSSVSIGNGRIYTMGKRDGGEHLIAMDLKNGKVLWSVNVGTGGDSNCTPTIDGDRIYTIGKSGDLACVDGTKGEIIWAKSFSRDFGGKMMSQWGYSESPLVDGDRLICTPGGPQAMVVALDKNTGKTIWRTPMANGGRRGTDGAGYASVVISHGGGVKQYITLVGRGLISIAASDGRPLWQYEKIANSTANVPTPIVDGDYVFCSSGYNDGGTALLQLSSQRRGQVKFREVYYKSANELQNHHGGMIKIGNYVYMGEGHNKGFPMCVEFETGRPVWDKRRGAGTGSAAIVAANGHLYFRYQNGVMALIEANPKEYKLKGTFRIASVHRESWPHPVIYDGKLFLRDQHQLHCYDIASK